MTLVAVYSNRGFPTTKYEVRSKKYEVRSANILINLEPFFQWFHGSMDPPLTQKAMAGKKDPQRGKGRLPVINKVQSMLIYI
jgi:hypothetical protein